MLGSTETTFYTIAVYFGSAGIIRTRHTVPAALAADLTGFWPPPSRCGCSSAPDGAASRAVKLR